MIALHDAKAIVGNLIDAPLYVVEACSLSTQLSEAERRFIAPTLASNVRAFTGTGLDVLLHNSALRYQWRGRGCAIVLSEPADCLSAESLLGVLVHEAAHYADACDDPMRDAPRDGINGRKLWRSLLNGERHHHGPTWLAAAVHLYWRAKQAHPQLRIRDVLPRRYGNSQASIEAAWRDAPAMAHLAIDAVVRAYRRDLKTRDRRQQRRPAATSGAPLGLVDIIHGRVCQTLNGRTTISGVRVTEKEFRTFMRTGKVSDRARAQFRKRALLSAHSPLNGDRSKHAPSVPRRLALVTA